MTEENKNQNPEPTNADLQWEQFSTVEPERTDIKYPEDEGVDGLGSSVGGSSSGDNGGEIVHGSLTQRMRNSPKLSDLQTVVLQAFPDLLKKWLNVLTMAEIFPDTYNDYLIIFVKELMQDDKSITLGEAFAYVQTALSIALDREGRLDLIAIHNGAINTQSEKDKGLL
jgi:hypothetical protein